ncbi:tRNA lysidine(34) synthetase TilS [Indiicoccus explosivorum]|uniref:tRNA lysidine(34) synthetase TilS n=1 Tax=Indiicoccus explosivorum TaxID=1917864 RepID=UPI000B4487A8|nr:tRNA lysidine(34) synthetase TilS [Indiicoccus explosivorum]
MVRQYDEVEFSHAISVPADRELGVPIASGWSRPIKGFSFQISEAKKEPLENTAEMWYFSPDDHIPLSVRGRKKGDRIQLPGMQSPKKISRLMIDEKLPAPDRDWWPLIVNGNDEILLVPGIRSSSWLRRHPREGDWVLAVRSVSGDTKSYYNLGGYHATE